jgi:hypothetical protein
VFKQPWKLACLALAILPGVARAQDTPKDVPPSHWAYTAVQDLASKGLIKGYPPDNRFLGGRTLTRYEMATIIERVLARVDDLLGAKANKGDSDNKADKADIARLESSAAEIRDLIAEFRKELLVIGADLNAAKDEIATLKGQVAAANTRANEAATLADQALESLNEYKTSNNAAMAKKATVDKAASLHVGGTFHLWAETAFGGDPNGNSPTNFSSAAPGRQFASGNTYGDTFRIKRGEIYFTGQMMPGSPDANPTDPGNKPGQAYYYVLLDTGKVMSNQNGNLQPNSTILQDVFVGYQLAKRWRFELGQQKTDMDEEGSRSSAELYTAERSIMNLLPVVQNGDASHAIGGVGRVGYVRDIGALFRYNGSLGRAMVGVWNGNGTGQASGDQTRQHFADFNAYFTGIKHLTVGVWGGEDFGDSEPQFKTDRIGATVLYMNGQHLFEAEGGYTRDFSPLYSSGHYTGVYQGSYGRGGYALYGYSATNKLQLIGRFDVWDPAYQAGQAAASVTTIGGYSIPHLYHDLREYTFGVNYYFFGKLYKKDGMPSLDINGNPRWDQRFKAQLNYIVDAVESNGVSFWGKSRNLLLLNLQAAF